MIRKYLLPLFIAAFAVVVFSETASAQEVVAAPEVRASPMAIAAKTLDDGTHVKIVYGSPRRQHPESGEIRTVFGELVPYGEVWRLGANEATEITTTGDIEFAGRTLPAGTYSLFTIPQEDTWTIIVNEGLGQWGAYTYDEASYLFRVEVPVVDPTATHDAFTISFPEDSSNLSMVWEDTQVVIPIEPM